MTVEQKAEKYAKNLLKDVTCNIGHPRTRQINSIDIEDAWLYGYKEGFKDCQKEHEWHSVIDGDLPKHNHEVLCLMWGGTKEIGYYENEVWHFENFVADYEDVDYWQEIVLPKEIE